MQIKISQSRQFKCLIFYVVIHAISYNVYSNHHATFSSQKLLLFQDTGWRS